jgi:hypothetical protein
MIRRLILLAALVCGTAIVSDVFADQLRRPVLKQVPAEDEPSGDLLTAAQLLSGYQGGFRMDNTQSNGHWPESVPSVMAYRDNGVNPGTLFIANAEGWLAESSIATPVNTGTVGSMNRASYVQGWVDPLENDANYHVLESMDGCTLAQRTGGSCNPAGFTGMLVDGGVLLGVHVIQYDSGNVQQKSHWSRPLNLSTTGSVVGPTWFFDGVEGDTGFTPNTGFTAGYLADIPTAREADLDAAVASGWCCPSIIARTSYGPGLGGFTPSDIGGSSPPKTWYPYVMYPTTHQTLGAWLAAGPYFGVGSSIRGAVIIDGTDTVAFFGSHGTTFCYGPGTVDPDLIGDPYPDPVLGPYEYCEDPTNNNEANHGWPYYYSVHLYDINDFIAVRNGTMEPWEVVPYERANITFPVTAASNQVESISGVAWDPVGRRLFLAQYGVDQTSGTNMGIVQVYVVPTP